MRLVENPMYCISRCETNKRSNSWRAKNTKALRERKERTTSQIHQTKLKQEASEVIVIEDSDEDERLGQANLLPPLMQQEDTQDSLITIPLPVYQNAVQPNSHRQGRLDDGLDFPETLPDFPPDSMYTDGRSQVPSSPASAHLPRPRGELNLAPPPLPGRAFRPAQAPRLSITRETPSRHRSNATKTDNAPVTRRPALQQISGNTTRSDGHSARSKKVETGAKRKAISISDLLN